MSDRFLFWVPTLIWATTWHTILYQLGEVSVLHSVALRFGLASAMLFSIARWRGESLRVPPRMHLWLMLTGAVQYGFNYMSTYHSEQHLASGLVAVVFTLMIFSNAMAGALFFGQPMTRRFMAFSGVGVFGIALIFWPDIAAAQANTGVWVGMAWALMAISFATVGNVLTLRLTRGGLSLVPVLAWSMGYGALTLVLVAAASGIAFVVDARWTYWASLVYLSAFGSVAAFLLYFKLAQRQGPGRAALMGMVIPVIALVVSALFEGWRPTAVSAAGIALCLAGLWGATRPVVAKP
ncbi:DMT family transporter [Rhodoferax aquaticus]|uniref:DMT family transporter n=1 Tax=Rhodoferax aquaticus TaxID=2527691 RepID=A0A515ELE0_9BURK|nr:DMT family transporter [Rhodoferax aquaticus]QDL53482.1 DMT family transporter [Rhodoferax aquaticus]